MALDPTQNVRIPAQPALPARGPAANEGADTPEAEVQLKSDANRAGRARGLTGPLGTEVDLDSIDFDKLDINDDGYLSGKELKGLKGLDKDANGRLTRDEFDKGIEKRLRRQDEAEFKRRDITQDGWLSGSEMKDILNYDTNSDGEITKAEFMAGRAAARANGGNGGETTAPQDANAAVEHLAANYDAIAGGDGQVSREDLEARMPDGPGKKALLKHFDALIFGNIDGGKAAWRNLSKADVEKLQGALAGGVKLEDHASQLVEKVARERGLGDITKDGKVDYADLKKYVESYGKTTGPDAPVDKPEDPPQGGGETYTVKPGDTLSKIARQYTNDANRWRELAAANPEIKDPNLIRPGQVLKIPSEWVKKEAVEKDFSGLGRRIEQLEDQMKGLDAQIERADDPKQKLRLNMQKQVLAGQLETVKAGKDEINAIEAGLGRSPSDQQLRDRLRGLAQQLAAADDPKAQYRLLNQVKATGIQAEHPEMDLTNDLNAISAAHNRGWDRIQGLHQQLAASEDPKQMQRLQMQLAVATEAYNDVRRGSDVLLEVLEKAAGGSPENRRVQDRARDLFQRLAQADDPKARTQILSQMERELTQVSNPHFRPIPAFDALVQARARARDELTSLTQQFNATDDPRQMQRLAMRLQAAEAREGQLAQLEQVLHEAGRKLSAEPQETLAWGRLNELVLQYINAGDEARMAEIDAVADQIQ